MMVSGKVDKIGHKFYGSLLVNGTWYNFKKGVAHADIKVGGVYQLDLDEWSFKGKTGVNISRYVEVPSADVPAPKVAAPAKGVATGRDFDKENRGKVKSLFIEALLSNPNVMQSLDHLSALNDEEVQDELDKLVETVF